MVLPATLAAFTSTVLFVACASFARGETVEAKSAALAASDVALLVSPQPGATVPNPYSFADLFHLTVGAQYGLISGAAVGAAGTASAGRHDRTHPSHLTPALFGGAGVPSLALGSSASVAGAMIGIPQGDGPSTGDYAVRIGGANGPVFRFQEDLLPLGRMPEPASWLIVSSVLLVGCFIARRRAAAPSA